MKIPFLAAVPFLGQEKMWPEKSQQYYRELLAQAAEIKIVSGGGYAAWKMQIRNQYMIDNCGLVIACFDGSKGGTNNAVSYARSVDREIKIIDPTVLWEKIK